MPDELFRLQEEVESLRFELSHARSSIAASINAIASRAQADDISRKVAPEVRGARQSAYLEVRDAVQGMFPEVQAEKLRSQLIAARHAERERAVKMIDRVMQDESTALNSKDAIRALSRLKQLLLGRPDRSLEPKDRGAIPPTMNPGRRGRVRDPVVSAVVGGIRVDPNDVKWVRVLLAEGMSQEDARAALIERRAKLDQRREERTIVKRIAESGVALAEDEEFMRELQRRKEAEESEKRVQRLDLNYAIRMRGKGWSEEQIAAGLAERVAKRLKKATEADE